MRLHQDLNLCSKFQEFDLRRVTAPRGAIVHSANARAAYLQAHLHRIPTLAENHLLPPSKTLTVPLGNFRLKLSSTKPVNFGQAELIVNCTCSANSTDIVRSLDWVIWKLPDASAL